MPKQDVQITQNKIWKMDNRSLLRGFHCPCLSVDGDITFMHIYNKFLELCNI